MGYRQRVQSLLVNSCWIHLSSPIFTETDLDQCPLLSWLLLTSLCGLQQTFWPVCFFRMPFLHSLFFDCSRSFCFQIWKRGRGWGRVFDGEPPPQLLLSSLALMAFLGLISSTAVDLFLPWFSWPGSHQHGMEPWMRNWKIWILGQGLPLVAIILSSISGTPDPYP